MNVEYCLISSIVDLASFLNSVTKRKLKFLSFLARKAPWKTKYEQFAWHFDENLRPYTLGFVNCISKDLERRISSQKVLTMSLKLAKNPFSVTSFMNGTVSYQTFFKTLFQTKKGMENCFLSIWVWFEKLLIFLLIGEKRNITKVYWTPISFQLINELLKFE